RRYRKAQSRDKPDRTVHHQFRLLSSSGQTARLKRDHPSLSVPRARVVERSAEGELQETNMARLKGAELITEYLIANGIPYVFGICGHGNVGMLDPLYHARDRIKLVSPRHEQVAAHMADAYFRVRHEP